jgi:hypothetical protein
MGKYYTPKKLECQINNMVKGLDCKSRTDNINDWCENCKEKYLKIADLSTGTSAFLKSAADSVIGNPPYAFQHSMHWTARVWRKIINFIGSVVSSLRRQ